MCILKNDVSAGILGISYNGVWGPFICHLSVILVEQDLSNHSLLALYIYWDGKYAIGRESNYYY